MSRLLFFGYLILITAQLLRAEEDDSKELDTGQPDVSYRKVHKIINQTNERLITKTIIKPVSYSYITASINPKSPDETPKFTAVHVQREDSAITEVSPTEEIVQHEESQIRPNRNREILAQAPQNPQVSYVPVENNNTRPVLVKHVKIEKPRPKKIVKYLQPVLIKTQRIIHKPKVQILTKKQYYVKRPEEARHVVAKPKPKPKPKHPPPPNPAKTQQPAKNKEVVVNAENRQKPVVNRNAVQFPLRSVLPGNSIHFNDANYEDLAPAVNSFSDLNPNRSPNEGLVVTHNTASSPNGQATRTHTRITNHGQPSGNYPQRDYSATSYNTRGDDGDHYERAENLRVKDNNGDESYNRYRSGEYNSGGGGGGGGGGKKKHHESEGGSSHKEEHDSKHGEKGEKGYKKKHKEEKGKKGHHDKENHSGEYEEKKGHEKKKEETDGYYGEHHEAKKGEKGKKYGEGGKHKKGHSTHGEHSIVKKDEYVKHTKFYDEDHDDGEHEEHGAYYGKHEEKKGGHKKGGHHESEHEKDLKAKKGHQDKGHEEEAHKGHEASEGHDDFYEHEEKYGQKKGGESKKKWGKSSGDHRK